MRILIFIPAFILFTFGLSAHETNSVAPLETNSPVALKISAADATNFYDREMIVTGKVAQVTIRPTVTFLNLDKKYPDSPFSVVIIHGHSQFFGDANALKGKSIEIKGKITNYKDKPEIALDNTNQLTVFDSSGKVITPTILQRAGAAPISSPTNSPPVAPSTNSFPEIF
jgi:DNA/RNA endonuclease YhcR with UshA esterase domain